MEKKLIAQGPVGRKSYTLTLPLEWVKENGLEDERRVNLEIVENKCVVSGFLKAESTISIDGRVFEKVFLKIIPMIYKTGVNEIKVVNCNAKSIKELNSIVESKLVGFEILDQGSDFVVIKDISGEKIQDFDNVFRRVYRLLIELSKNEEPDNVLNLTKNIEKLLSYCQRILIKNPTNYKNQTFLFSYMNYLEAISDEYKWLFLNCKVDSGKLGKVNDCLNASYELFYKFDSNKFVDFQYRTYELKNSLKLNGKMDLALMHLHNLARHLNILFGFLLTVNVG